MTESQTFIEDLLKEAEQKEECQTAAYFDLLILEINSLETKIRENFSIAEQETKLISDWAINHNLKIQEKADFLKLRLENYIRSEQKKSISLPHGTLRLRKKPDRVIIEDLDSFLKDAKSEMLTVISESLKPDLNGIKTFIKRSGKIPNGVNLLIGEEEFSLTINNEE